MNVKLDARHISVIFSKPYGDCAAIGHNRLEGLTLFVPICSAYMLEGLFSTIS